VEGRIGIAQKEVVSKRGCAFRPRCEFAKGICGSRKPALVEVERGHGVRCFLHSASVEETR